MTAARDPEACWELTAQERLSDGREFQVQHRVKLKTGEYCRASDDAAARPGIGHGRFGPADIDLVEYRTVEGAAL